ncbi:hypothetical protein LSAT2_021624, partial [Lamellibrachia satsuma]
MLTFVLFADTVLTLYDLSDTNIFNTDHKMPPPQLDVPRRMELCVLRLRLFVGERRATRAQSVATPAKRNAAGSRRAKQRGVLTAH